MIIRTAAPIFARDGRSENWIRKGELIRAELFAISNSPRRSAKNDQKCGGSSELLRRQKNSAKRLKVEILFWVAPKYE
jgi:hypothetical protein